MAMSVLGVASPQLVILRIASSVGSAKPSAVLSDTLPPLTMATGEKHWCSWLMKVCDAACPPKRIFFSDEQSCLPKSGWFIIIHSMIGAATAQVARSVSISRMASSGAKARITTHLPPVSSAGMKSVYTAVLWYSGGMQMLMSSTPRPLAACTMFCAQPSALMCMAIVPLGTPVVPEVNEIAHRSHSSMPVCTGASAPSRLSSAKPSVPGAAASPVMNTGFTLCSWLRTDASLSCHTSGDTTMPLAPTLLICAARPSAVRPRFTGTAMPPSDTMAR